MSLSIYGSSFLTLDIKGRIVIPDNLKVYSQIEKDVIIIGMINKIEIWNPDKIEKYNSNINIDEFNKIIKFLK